MVAPLAEKHGIKIQQKCSDTTDLTMGKCRDTAIVRADSVRLRQVMIKLLSNAIKYNRPRGTVTLSCESTAGKVRINVTDTGLGIPADKQNQLFSAFDRLDENRAR